ncbi:hypothetical protein pb186bvf_003502 [Paramecium bursaria]
MSKVIYSSAKPDDNEELPQNDQSQIEYLKKKLRLAQQNIKTAESEMKQLRLENEKLRQLNADYVKQLNQMAAEKYQKIEKIVVQQQFFEQKNFDNQLKDFIRKMTSNFNGLEKQHSKLIDHCRVMEHDINYYKQRVIEADEINENLRSIGKSNITELMDELKSLQNRVDSLSDELQQSNFKLAVKTDECERKIQELETASQVQEDLLNQIDEVKAKQNRLLSEHVEKSNKDGKLIYQLKIKSDFLEHERRLAYQDAAHANQERTVIAAKSQSMEHELDVLRNTTESFLKTNKHIFNLAGLPKIQFK